MGIREELARLPQFGIDNAFYNSNDEDYEELDFTGYMPRMQDYNSYEDDLINIDIGALGGSETRPRVPSKIYPNHGLTTRGRTMGEDRAERAAMTEFRNNAEWIKRMGLEDTYHRNLAQAEGDTFPGNMATLTEGLFDFLQAGNFATATGVDEFLDHYNRSNGAIFESAYEGFKQAGIEFADAFTPDFYTNGQARKMVFGDVLRDHFGFEDTSNQMFYESGTAAAGLFFDIFLDPLTYTGYGLAKSLRMFRGISPIQDAERYIKSSTPGRAFRARFVPKSLLKGLQEGENAEATAAFLNGRLKEGGTPMTAEDVKEGAAEVLAALGTREQTIQMEESLLQNELVSLFSGFNNAELRLMGTFMLDQPTFGKTIRDQLNITDAQKDRMERAVGTFRKTLDKWFDNEVSVGLLSENQHRANYAMGLASQTGESKALFELMARIRFGSLSGRFMDDIAPGYSVRTADGTAFFEKEKGYPTLVSRILDGVNTETNIALSGAKRGIESIRRFNTKKLFDTVLQDERIAMKVDNAILQDKFHPFHDDMKKHGMKLWKGSVGDLGGEVTYALPEALVDHLNDAHKIFSDPSEMNKFWNGFKEVQNVWKSYALMSPGYHMRNMYSNIFNNMIAGVRNPAKYAEGMVLEAEDTARLPWGVRSMIEFQMGGRQTLDTFQISRKNPNTGDPETISLRKLKEEGNRRGIGAGGFFAHEGPATVESELMRQFSGAIRTPDGLDIRTMENVWGKTDDRRRSVADMMRKAAPQLTDKQSMDLASVYDSIAARWALSRGLSPKEFYEQNLQEIIPGLPAGIDPSDPTKNFLFDKVQAAEFYSRVQRHVDRAFAETKSGDLKAEALLSTLKAGGPFSKSEVDWTGLRGFLERRLEDHAEKWKAYRAAIDKKSPEEIKDIVKPNADAVVSQQAVNAWLSSKEGFKQGRLKLKLLNAKKNVGWSHKTINDAIERVTAKDETGQYKYVAEPSYKDAAENQSIASLEQGADATIKQLDDSIAEYDEYLHIKGFQDDVASFEADLQLDKGDLEHGDIATRNFLLNDEDGLARNAQFDTILKDWEFDPTNKMNADNFFENNISMTMDGLGGDQEYERLAAEWYDTFIQKWKAVSEKAGSPADMPHNYIQLQADQALDLRKQNKLAEWKATGGLVTEHPYRHNLQVRRTKKADEDPEKFYSTYEKNQVKHHKEWFEVTYDEITDPGALAQASNARPERLVFTSEEDLKDFLKSDTIRKEANHPATMDEFPGGENYNEHLLIWDPGTEELSKSYTKREGTDVSLQEGHFPLMTPDGEFHRSNVVGWARTKDYIDENGDKNLVILELQSDWTANTGRSFEDTAWQSRFMPLVGHAKKRFFIDKYGTEQAFLKGKSDPSLVPKIADVEKTVTDVERVQLNIKELEAKEKAEGTLSKSEQKELKKGKGLLAEKQRELTVEAPYTWDTLPKEETFYSPAGQGATYRISGPKIKQVRMSESQGGKIMWDVEYDVYQTTKETSEGAIEDIPKNQQFKIPDMDWSLGVATGGRLAKSENEAKRHLVDLVNKKLYEFSVPDSPFHDNKAWAEVTMKHMARQAMEEKYDKIAWLRSEDQFRALERWGPARNFGGDARREAEETNLLNTQGPLRKALENSQSMVRVFNKMAEEMHLGDNAVHINHVPIERSPYTKRGMGTDLNPEQKYMYKSRALDESTLEGQGLTSAEQAAIINEQPVRWGNRLKKELSIEEVNRAINLTWEERALYQRGTTEVSPILAAPPIIDDPLTGSPIQAVDIGRAIKEGDVDADLYREIRDRYNSKARGIFQKEADVHQSLENKYGPRGGDKWRDSDYGAESPEEAYQNISKKTENELLGAKLEYEEELATKTGYLIKDHEFGSVLNTSEKNIIKRAVEKAMAMDGPARKFDDEVRAGSTVMRGIGVNFQKIIDSLDDAYGTSKIEQKMAHRLKSKLEDNMWSVPRGSSLSVDDEYGAISGMVNAFDLRPWRQNPSAPVSLMQRQRLSARPRSESDVLYQKGRDPSSYSIDGYGSGMKGLTPERRAAYDRLTDKEKKQVQEVQKRARDKRREQGYGGDTEYIQGGDALYDYRQQLVEKPGSILLNPMAVRRAVSEIVDEMPDSYKGVDLTAPIDVSPMHSTMAATAQGRIARFNRRLDELHESGQKIKADNVTRFLALNFNKLLQDQGYTFKELTELGEHVSNTEWLASKSGKTGEVVADHVKYYDGEEWNPVVINRAFMEKVIADDELLKSKAMFTPENRRAISHSLRSFTDEFELARFDSWTPKQLDSFVKVLLKSRQRDAGKQSQVRNFFKQNFKHTTKEPPINISPDAELADEIARQQMSTLSRIPESDPYQQQLDDLRKFSERDLNPVVAERAARRIEDLQVGQITRHNEIFPSTTVREAQLLPSLRGRKTFDIPNAFNLTALKRFKKNKTWWEALVPTEQKRINNSIKTLEDLKSKGNYEEVKKKIRGKQHLIGRLTEKGYLLQRKAADNLPEGAVVDDILGAVEFTDDEIVPFRAQGTSVMYAGQGANPSTFIHEMGHVIRRFLIDEGDELAINRWIFGEKEAIIAHKKGIPLNWGVDEEEAFAEAFENFVVKGIKPHGALRALEGPFERLQVNLEEVYKDLRKSGSEFDGNVEEVMRRVLGRGVDPNPEEFNLVKALIQSSQKKFQKEYGGLDIPIKERIKSAVGGPKIKGRSLVEWNHEIGHAFENNARWAHYIQKWQDGLSHDKAAESVKRFLFDYNELTPFERDVMKTIIPFYTWMRKNIPLQIQMLIEKPEFYAKIPKFMSEIEGMSNALADDNGKIQTPDYFDEVNAIRLPWQNDGQPVYIAQDLPFQDLNRLNYKDMLSQMSPFLKIWGALAIDKGYDFFLEAPIEQFAGEPAIIDLFGEPSELPISKKWEYAIKTMVPPAGKALRFLDKAAQGRAEDQLFREVLGLSITSVDVDAVVRSKRYQRAEVSSLLRRKVRKQIQRFGLEDALKKSGSRLVN